MKQKIKNNSSPAVLEPLTSWILVRAPARHRDHEKKIQKPEIADESGTIARRSNANVDYEIVLFDFWEHPTVRGRHTDMPRPNKKKKFETSAVRRVVAYARVSTEQQAVDGSSLETQRDRLIAYAAAVGLEIVALEVDAGISASTLDRPALTRALARLEAGEAEGLLVVKLDRLSRSLRDMVSLVDTYFKNRFALMSVSESIDTGTLTGRLILNVLTAVAEWEREAAAERTQAVMAHMKASGKFTGGWPPFGWKLDEDDGSLIEDPHEQAIKMTVKHLREDGMSLRKIALEIPVNPDTGKPYSASQISRML